MGPTALKRLSAKCEEACRGLKMCLSVPKLPLGDERNKSRGDEFPKKSQRVNKKSWMESEKTVFLLFFISKIGQELSNRVHQRSLGAGLGSRLIPTKWCLAATMSRDEAAILPCKEPYRTRREKAVKRTAGHKSSFSFFFFSAIRDNK